MKTKSRTTTKRTPAAALGKGGHREARHAANTKTADTEKTDGSLASAQTRAAQATAQEAEIIRQTSQIILNAFTSRASDIHLEPHKGKLRLRFRIDGVLRDQPAPPPELTRAIIDRIKIMASMDPKEKRLPQDCRIKMQALGRELDLRVSTLPVMLGERVTIRILDRNTIKSDLGCIGFTGKNIETVRHLCQAPHGIVLCTGSTGSGKTTLMYTMLQELDRQERNIMTVEDPIEYSFDDISQVAVNASVGLTFARALRSVLRQAPDVVMVGEIRDTETLMLCYQVAITGHLLITGLHAGTAPAAVRRLLDMGSDPFLVNTSLSGVIAQRLIRLLCPKCKQKVKLADNNQFPREARDILHGLGATYVYQPKGCDACHNTGYLGRTAIHEILIPNDEFRRAVSAVGDLATLRAAARKAGMQTLAEDGLAKVAQGITSVEEVLRVTLPGPND